MSAKKKPSRSAPLGRVKWKRFAVILLPAAAIAGTLIGLTAKGVLAANISVSGQQFLVTSSELNGTGFEQFGGQVNESNGTVHPVVVSAINQATLADLCQSVTIGPITLRLTAGGGGTPVSASNLIVDASALSGNATFRNITIGQDAGGLTSDPGTSGPSGMFGEQAESVKIDNLVQHTWLTTAGTFTLPGLSLGFGGSCP